MEVVSNNRFYKLHWFWNIMRHGLLFQGLRNRIAKTGIDIMPYYWTLKGDHSCLAPKITGDSSNFSISFFGKEDIETAQSLIGGSYYKKLLDYHNEGDICVGIKEFDVIVAFMFIKRGAHCVRGKTFELKEHEVYLHSMYTFEAYRGRRIAPYLRYKCYEICGEMGITDFYSVTEYFNRASRRFKKKLNVKHVALYVSVKLFNKFNKTYLLKKYDVENA